jgi:hypothetical protein
MTNVAAPAPKWLHWVARNRKPTAYILVVLAIPLMGVAIWRGLIAFKDPALPKWDELAFMFWTGLLALSAAASGVWQLMMERDESGSLDNARMLVLGLGGLVGLITTLAGSGLVIAWWSEVVSWFQEGSPREPYKGVVAALTVFGGLAVMFASLQGTRTEERSNATLRRLLYGYNAFLTGLLLLVILIITSTLLCIKFPQSLDFTRSNIYTLSSQSVNMLKGLDKPTKVYVILSRNDPLYDEVRTLLVNCREVNERLEVEEKSPQQDDLTDLETTYPQLAGEGVLVVYGDESPRDHRFIRRDDLFTFDERRGMTRSSGESESFKFKGEDALMTQLRSLTEGKQKTVIYFTQGNGELDLKSFDSARADQGLGNLKDRLEKRGFKVEPLTFGLGTAKVPDDATVVVIAGPRSAFSPEAVKALRDYLTRPTGRLLLLLEPPTAMLQGPQPTGLEGLLRDYEVNIPNQRLLAVPVAQLGQRTPTDVLVRTSSDRRDNPISAAFSTLLFSFSDARPVQPLSETGSGGRKYRVETFLEAPGLDSRIRQFIWAESDLKTPANELAREVFQDLRKGERGKVSASAISVGVTVAEGDTSDPHAGIRGAPPLGQQQKPRMVVIGDATIASNRMIGNEAGRNLIFDLIASSIDWLRGRESSIGIPPKERQFYTLQRDPSAWTLTWVPTMLMAVAIVGLGTGVWIVRRR